MELHVHILILNSLIKQYSVSVEKLSADSCPAKIWSVFLKFSDEL